MGRALVGGSIELWLMYVHLFFDQSSLVFCRDITRPPLFIHWAIEAAKNDWIYMLFKVIYNNQSNIYTDFIRDPLYNTLTYTIDSLLFSLFELKKVYLQAKICNFLSFMLISFVVKCYYIWSKTVFLYSFWPWKYEKKQPLILKQPSRNFHYCWNGSISLETAKVRD